MVGYLKEIRDHLLILTSFGSLPTLIGWEWKQRGQWPCQERVLGGYSRGV